VLAFFCAQNLCTVFNKQVVGTIKIDVLRGNETK
ncbi:TPA_asm: sugar phosphate isomerase/epimerase, partial [Listeria monocytogenes]|nr:sugar phosphate isomerase/epimerase [Listeria monocytogenes]